ncbi:MAG TPA: glycosyltransferase family 4 protein [Candidatus Limnocylindria bacterium]|nr:glycosyltransferase family 4 protein [Candidatus Limnocylindria bacterium]
MRVVIAKKLLSTVGGSEALARALDRELRALGHDVTLVGLRPAWPRPGVPREALAAPPGPVTIGADGTRFVFLPARGGRVGAAIDGLWPTSLVRADDLRHAVAGADVVHSIAREWAGPLEHAARETGAAFVETPLVHPGQPFSGAGDADLRRYRRDDAVIALTEWEAAWYRERGVRNVHVTGVGPNLRALPEVAREAATVLFVGRRERYKGYHALRAAARLVWAERPDAHFVTIGQAAWNAVLDRGARDPRWVDRGVVSEEEKAEAYARATIFAMPSEHETFGHTYLEAWSAGLPVIAGDIAPLREVVREGVDGLHVANEPRAIARTILALLRDPDRARRMGAAGRERLEREFSWPAVARRTEAAYLAAVSTRDGRRARM